MAGVARKPGGLPSISGSLPTDDSCSAVVALSVIPSLKITDQGLVDVDRFELVPLEASDLDHLGG